jgi:hypothetical protein
MGRCSAMAEAPLGAPGAMPALGFGRDRADLGRGCQRPGVGGGGRATMAHPVQSLRCGQFNVLRIYGTEFCRIHDVYKGGFERDKPSNRLQSSIDGSK